MSLPAERVAEASVVDVAVVGGGPVGLYLGARLAGAGVEVAVLEAREAPSSHSRAIGVHPPGLAALARVGAAEPLVRRGVRVVRGHAFGGDGTTGARPLGTLDLGRLLPPPYPFVLTVPQTVTEEVLAERLEASAPGALRRGVRVTGVSEGADEVTVHARVRPGRAADYAPAGQDGPAAGTRGTAASADVRARICVACDGSGGLGARMAGVGMRGGRYGDTYLMADARDPTPLGSEAAIHLPPGGVVESFPLPSGMRRWVVKTERLLPGAGPEAFVALVRERIGPRFAPRDAGPPSAFGVGWRLADSLARGRVWLAGDAAHVISPIGGQGMNLGWLGAAEAADAIRSHLRGEASLREAAEAYDAAQRPRARSAAARAAWNMRAGRTTRLAGPRDLTVRALLSFPLSAWAARLFTMQA